MVSRVPTSWLIGRRQTYWPKVPMKVLTNYVENLLEPEENWDSYTIRILGTASMFDVQLFLSE